MIKLEGTYTALVTPFREDARTIDPARLSAAISRQSIAGVDGVVPCGTTGEAPTLTETEHRAVIEHTVAVAAPLGLSVIAGAGANDTAHAVHLHSVAAAMGADATLHVTPYYNKPSQEGLYHHFMTVADAGSLPIVLYNIPGRTGVALSVDTVRRLARHENIVAIKDATGDVITAGVIAAETDLAVLSGDDPLTLPLMSVGATGVISVLSNVFPDRVSGLVNSVRSGDFESALRHHRRLLPLARALLELDSNPVPVKTALHVLGLDTGAVRPPLAPGADGVRKRLETLLAAERGAQRWTGLSDDDRSRLSVI